MTEDNITYKEWTSLANVVLSRLGRETLLDLASDTSPDAEMARRFLVDSIAFCCEYFDWSFLKRTQALEYEHDDDRNINVFRFPNNVARLTKVDTKDEEFDIEAIGVVTESEYCTITYEEYPKVPKKLPNAFKTAIESYLGYLLSTPLTGNDNLRAEFYQLYSANIEKARTNDRTYLPKRYSDKNTDWWTTTLGM